MLEALRIRDLGVIDDVEIRLGAGLTVVTGETGAGKTMVVTGLQLLFGGRADASRVRSGADQASVEGRLTLDPAGPAAARALDAGAEIEDGELVLRRTVAPNGRSRAHVGGTSAPVAVLAAVGADVFTVHGQTDQLRLSQPTEQRRALDRFAGLELEEYQAAFRRWQDLQARLQQWESDAAARRREADLLNHGLAEIDAAEPIAGEDAELAELTRRLAAADDLARAAGAAHNALLGDSEDPSSDAVDVQGLLGLARRELATVSADDPELAGLAVRLTEVEGAVNDLGADLAAYRDGIEGDPQRLEAAQLRRARLAGLVRKYARPRADGERPELAEVLEWAAEARARLAEIDPSEDAVAELVAERDRARADAARAAGRIRQARTEAAGSLARRVTAELQGLAMAEASFEVTVRARPPLAGSPSLVVDDVAGGADGGPSGAGADGTDEVEFLLRARPGGPAVSVHKGASGGELSRVMLAVEVILAQSDPVPIMVFDEVDAGVGGRAAIEVGRRLSRLAAGHQVIVVTHLAQVAAFADEHLVVTSRPEEAVGRSDVQAVTGSERLSELARMLAGRDTGVARRHARELLIDAQQDKQAPVNEAPVNEAPVNEAPVNEAPVNEAPVNEAPVNEAPVNEAPVKTASKSAAKSAAKSAPKSAARVRAAKSTG